VNDALEKGGGCLLLSRLDHESVLQQRWHPSSQTPTMRMEQTMSVVETADAISNLIKTILTGLFVCVLGYGGGWLYIHFTPDVRLRQREHELQQARTSLDAANRQVASQDMMIDRLGEDLETSQRRIAELDTSLQLLKVTHRVAEINVLRQFRNEADEFVSEFEFQEVNGQGTPIDKPHRFQVLGDLLYLDFLIVKFDDEYVENGDVDRGTSICLFRRMFGEHQEPYDGYTIDREGSRPNVYGRNGIISEFERQIWANFWNIANDPSLAASLGIRAAHGVAPAIRLRPRHRYRVTLRASDGLSVRPVEVAEQPLETSRT